MQTRTEPRSLGLIGLLLASFIIAGCSSTGTSDEPIEPQEPVAETQAPPAPVEPIAEDPSDFNAAGEPLDSNGNVLDRVFYFDYDKAVLKPNDLAALQVHAQILRRNSDRSVVLEGHCDERGTREYNLALGERRADSVRSFLLSAGVSSRQIETVSYGEEQPEDPGHNEAAWSRNRRAVMSYR